MLINKKWLSLVEVIIVIFIVSVWILWIVTVLSSIMQKSNKVNQKIISLDIAREWIEAVYQIRNNNVLQYESLECKELNRLNLDSTCSTPTCSTSSKMGSWYYYLSGTNLVNTGTILKVEGDMENSVYAMCLDDTTRLWWKCANGSGNLTKYWKFYRMITMEDPISVDTLACPKGSGSCDSSYSWQKLKFCSNVQYHEIWKAVNSVEICATMTNFF